MYLQKTRETERGRKAECGGWWGKRSPAIAAFPFGQPWPLFYKMASTTPSQPGLLLCPKSFLWVSRSTGLPSPFKEWSSWAEHDDLEKGGVSCPEGAVSSVAVQPLIFLMAPSWRRSSNKVCNLLSCIACGVRVTVKLHLFCVFFHSNMKSIGSSGAGTLIYHTGSTLARENIKTRSSEIAHLTEEQIDHNACPPWTVTFCVLQSWRAPCYGNTQCLYASVLGSLDLYWIRTGKLPCPAHPPQRSGCRNAHLSAVEAVSVMSRYCRVPDSESHRAGPVHGGDIDAFQFLSPVRLWTQHEPETTASWRGWALLTDGILPALKVASLGSWSVYTYVLNF